MGLLNLLPHDNQLSQMLMGFQQPLNDLGVGLQRGKTWQKGIREASNYTEEQAPLRAKLAQEQLKADTEAATRNRTAEWLRTQPGGEQFAAALENGMIDGSTAFKSWMDASKQGGNEYQDRFSAGQQYGLGGDDLNTFALTGALPGTNKQNVTFGVNPIYGTDANGNTVMMVQGTDGTSKVVDTGGVKPLGPYDLNAQKAAGSAFGRNTGGAQFDLPAAKLTTDQTLKAIEDVRANEKGLDEQFSLGGLQQLTPAWPGSEKAKFQVANQRLTNRAFLEAREVLRGGGQITDFESRKAEGAITNIEDAMARGDKQLYLKALKDFEDAVRDGYAKLEAQAGTMGGYGGQPAGGALPSISDKAAYDALPSGTRYVAPDGTTRTKP